MRKRGGLGGNEVGWRWRLEEQNDATMEKDKGGRSEMIGKTMNP